MDNKQKQDGRDDAKVDLHDASEVAYAAKAAGVSPDEYIAYAKQAGSNVRKVIAEHITRQKKD